MKQGVTAMKVLAILVAIVMVGSSTLILVQVDSSANQVYTPGKAEGGVTGFQYNSSATFETTNKSLSEFSWAFDFAGTSGVSVDYSNGLVYVSDGAYGKITVYSPMSNQVVGFISGSPYYGYSLYDSFDNTLYVAGSGNNILAINPGTGIVENNITGIQKSATATMLLDPVKDSIYVVTQGNTHIYIYEFSTTTGDIVYSNVIKTGYVGLIGSMAYDPENEFIYLPVHNDTLMALNTQGDTISGYYPASLDQQSKSLKIRPFSATYDPATGTIFVASCYFGGQYDNISEFSPASGSVVDMHRLGGDSNGTILPSPSFYDAATGMIFIENSETLRAYSPATGQTADMGSSLYTAEFSSDYLNGNLYGTNYNTLFWINEGTLSHYSTATSYDRPMGVVYDNFTGNIYVSNFQANYLTVINASTGNIAGKLNSKKWIGQLSLDQFNGYIFASNSSLSVSLIDPQNGSVVHNFGEEYVIANPENGTFYEIQGSRLKIASASNYTIEYTSEKIGDSVDGIIFDKPLNSLIISYTDYLNRSSYTYSFVIFNLTDYKTETFGGIGPHEMHSMALSPDGKILYWSDTYSSFGGTGAINLTSGNMMWIDQNQSGEIIYDPHNNLLCLIGTQGNWPEIAFYNVSTGEMLVQWGLAYSTPSDMAYDPVNYGIYISFGGFLGESGYPILVLNYTAPPSSGLSSEYNPIFDIFEVLGVVAILAVAVTAGYIMLKRRSRQ